MLIGLICIFVVFSLWEGYVYECVWMMLMYCDVDDGGLTMFGLLLVNVSE